MHGSQKIKLVIDSKTTEDSFALSSSVAAAKVPNDVDAWNIIPSFLTSLVLVFFVPLPRSLHCKTILD